MGTKRFIVGLLFLTIAGGRSRSAVPSPSLAIRRPAAALPVGTTGNCRGPAPTAAQGAGFTRLAFCDDFDSLATIDVNSTGNSGFRWYTNLPWGGGRKTLPGTYSVARSILNLRGVGGTANWGLSTLDPVTGVGRTWTHGYFEARISFTPEQKTGHPSFWMLSAEHTLTNNDRWAEWDIYESQNEPDGLRYAVTLHQWDRDANGRIWQYWNGDAFRPQPASLDWAQWHTVAGLWVAGHISWYLDSKLILSQAYSQNAPPSPGAATDKGINPTPAGVYWQIETEPKGMEMILGTGPSWPMMVDWVRIWENEAHR